MALLIFILGLILAICGGGALLASIDLLPTEMGMLYAGCGAVALTGSFVVVAISALIGRVDALAEDMRPAEAAAGPAPPREPGLSLARSAPEPAAGAGPEPVTASEAEAEAVAQTEAAVIEEDEAVNENRAGQLPTLHEVEQAIAHPEEPPTLVGRYSAGGANYMIFSDGTIEAEMEDGAFRFASMGEFKAYLAGRKA